MKGIFITTALLLLFACNNKPAETTATDAAAPTETKQERNKKIIEASFTAMRNLDAETMAKDMAPDIIDYGDGSMPPLKGTDSVKKYMGMWMAAMESFKAEDVVVVADGDRVWAYGTYTGKFKEDLHGMPVKGKTWTMKDVDMFVMNDDGKITEHRSVQAPEVMMNQLGIKPPKQ